jgi:hypothetical protein
MKKCKTESVGELIGFSSFLISWRTDKDFIAAIEPAIQRNGGSLDGGAGDRFRDRDQLGVELACGLSDVSVVEVAHKRGR